MILFKYIKYFFLFLLTFLLGGQNTYAKTKLVLSQNEVVFSIEQSQSFKSLEKEVQPNIGFLKEKTKFVAVQCSSAVNSSNFSKQSWRYLAEAVGGFVEYIKNGFKINASTLDNAFKHINDVTLNGAGKPKFSSNKLIGCHNELNFKAQSISNGGRIEIVNEIPTSVNGVKKIEYKTLKLDNQGNPIPGQYVSNGATHTKTVFDPTIYSEATMKNLGYNAFKDAMDNNKFDIIDPLTNNVIPRLFEGVSNGRTIQGYYKVVNGEKIIWTWWIIN